LRWEGPHAGLGRGGAAGSASVILEQSAREANGAPGSRR
jgi:hypothetical protein